MQPGEREPIFNVPGIVAGMVIVLIGVHVVRSLLLENDLNDVVIGLLSFNPARYSGEPIAFPGAEWTGVVAFVSHAFLHGDAMHLAINSAWLLAVGAPVARRMPQLSFVGFFLLCAGGGALLFLVMNLGVNAALVGASGAISGLMAAVFRLMYAAHQESDRYLLTHRPLDAPRLSVRSMFTQRAPFSAIAVWVVLNFVFAIALGSVGDGTQIAWEAHLGGFFVGLFTFDLFDRGNPEEVSSY